MVVIYDIHVLILLGLHNKTYFLLYTKIHYTMDKLFFNNHKVMKIDALPWGTFYKNFLEIVLVKKKKKTLLVVTLITYNN